MKYRKITGQERDQLLTSRKPSGFNYQPYIEVLDHARDGDVVAVDIGDKGERGEKIRFSRAARLRGKSLTWLISPGPNEIAFQLASGKTSRSRSRRSKSESQG